MEKIKLFCFPYAGGSAVVYNRFNKFLDKRIELCPIELAGRGKRFMVPAMDSISEIINDAYNAIKPQINSTPYAIMGYSMGSLISYEMYYKLKESNHQLPKHIFFCAKEAPNINSLDKLIHKLPDEELIEELVSLGGTPQEVLNNREILNIFLPIIRADYKVIERYDYNLKPHLLECNMTVINGKEDNYKMENIYEWGKLTSQTCRFEFLNGGHFFLHDNYESISKIINETI